MEIQWSLSACCGSNYHLVFVIIGMLLYECDSLVLREWACDWQGEYCAAAISHFKKHLLPWYHFDSFQLCSCLTGGVVHRRHLSPEQGGGVQSGSRHSGFLRHTLHHLCLHLRRHADVSTAARDRRRAGRAPDCEGPDHHAVRQPVAPLHPFLLTGSLLPHPGLLRCLEKTKGRVGRKKNTEEETWGRWRMDWFENCGSHIDLLLPPFCAIDWMNGWMYRWKTGGCIKASKNRMEGGTDAWKDNNINENHKS